MKSTQTAATSTLASLAGSSYQQLLSIYCIDSEAGSDILGGVANDTSTPPSTVSDSAAASEINNIISLLGWPGQKTDYLYFLYLPPGVQQVAAQSAQRLSGLARAR